jgi:hypothetical protein
MSNIQCYVTPLTLHALETYVQVLHAYKVHAHTLLTELDAKAKAHCHVAFGSIIEAISRTQVSLSLPQVLVCSLQVGIAEDKNNPLLDSIARPDELASLSLVTVALNSIETQLIDSRHTTAAIFKIDRIETQFRRLHDTPGPVTLSCISPHGSKVSFDCFRTVSEIAVSRAPGSIMYECALEKLSIKVI